MQEFWQEFYDYEKWTSVPVKITNGKGETYFETINIICCTRGHGVPLVEFDEPIERVIMYPRDKKGDLLRTIYRVSLTLYTNIRWRDEELVGMFHIDSKTVISIEITQILVSCVMDRLE